MESNRNNLKSGTGEEKVNGFAIADIEYVNSHTEHPGDEDDVDDEDEDVEDDLILGDEDELDDEDIDEDVADVEIDEDFDEDDMTW
jgi:hypothetical protein